MKTRAKIVECRDLSMDQGWAYWRFKDLQWESKGSEWDISQYKQVNDENNRKRAFIDLPQK